MKKKPSLLTILLYIILLSLITSFILIYYFNKVLGKNIIVYAENEVKYLTTIVINNSIKKYNQESNSANYLIIEKNTKGEINLISYNTKLINQTTTKITEILETDLKYLTQANFQKINIKIDTIPKEYYDKIKECIILTIPIGNITGNNLLNNIGPKIPIKIKLVDNVNTIFKTKVKEYGLNNALIETYIEVKVTIAIQMPFLSKKINIKNQIPLTTQIIQGTIHEYHIGKTN